MFQDAAAEVIQQMLAHPPSAPWAKIFAYGIAVEMLLAGPFDDEAWLRQCGLPRETEDE